MEELLERFLNEKVEEYYLMKQLVDLAAVTKEIKDMGWESIQQFLDEVEFAEPIVDDEVQTTMNTRTVKGTPIDDLIGSYVVDAEGEGAAFTPEQLQGMSKVKLPVFQLVHNTVYIENFECYKDKSGKVWCSESLIG